MLVKETTTLKIERELRFDENKKTDKTLSINDDLTILYNSVELSSYKVIFRIVGNSNVEIKLGCQVITVEQINQAILDLTGQARTTLERVIVGRNNQINPHPIVEESKSYYITANGKAYNKKNVNTKSIEFKHTSLKYAKRANWCSEKVWFWKNHNLGITQEVIDVENIYIKKLQYIVEAYNEIKNVLLNENK